MDGFDRIGKPGASATGVLSISYGEEVTTMVRVALITGASRGIGAATALLLAKNGYQVVINHRDSAPQAEEVVATIVAAGGEAVAIRGDVTKPEDVNAMVGAIDQRWGGTD